MEESFVEECMARKDLPKYLISKKFALQYTNILKKKDFISISAFVFDNKVLVGEIEKGNYNLTEKKDYIKVSELTWRFLEVLYSAEPELSESHYLKLKYPIKPNKNEILQTKLDSQTQESNSKNSTKKESKSIKKTSTLSAQEKIELCKKIVEEEQKINTNDQIEVPKEVMVIEKFNSNIPTIGLVNPSTYCFANAGIQCLISNQEFSSYFATGEYARIKTKTIKQKHITLAFSRLLQNINSDKKGLSCDHKEIRNIVARRFDTSMHNDCQEFIRFFLSEIQDELNPKPPKDYTLENLQSSSLAKEKYFSSHYSIVDQTFAGILKSEVNCNNCKNTSITYDPFLDLSLHFRKSGSKKIESMLDDFFSDELVTDYKCEKCKKKTKASKSTSIAHLPPVLMIHLMRISLAPRKQKINESIQYATSHFSLQKFGFSLKKIYGKGFNQNGRKL